MSDTAPRFFASYSFLLVKNIEASAAYYRDVFGFGIAGYNYSAGRKALCEISRDSVNVILREALRPELVRPNHLDAPDFSDAGESVMTVDLVIFVSDVRSLYKDVGSRGAKIVKRPEPEGESKPSFIALDRDGYRIEFIEQPKPAR